MMRSSTRYFVPFWVSIKEQNNKELAWFDKRFHEERVEEKKEKIYDIQPKKWNNAKSFPPHENLLHIRNVILFI